MNNSPRKDNAPSFLQPSLIVFACIFEGNVIQEGIIAGFPIFMEHLFYSKMVHLYAKGIQTEMALVQVFSLFTTIHLDGCTIIDNHGVNNPGFLLLQHCSANITN